MEVSSTTPQEEVVPSSLNGHPVEVVKATEGHGYELNIEGIESILLNPVIRNKPVAIVSVAGAFRKGKSFMLDFFLRFLKADCSNDWVGSPDDPLEGFHWRGGAERDTAGILVWSKPFIKKSSNGKEIAVLLMDTQGAFDCDSTVKDCATVFALSTMISSVQIYNLQGNLQENDLQHLQLFTEYGRIALAEVDSKPFQQLIFLIRDWPFPYEFDFGWNGGDTFLAKKLAAEDRHKELQSVRTHIKSCFENAECFLMPHPGKIVASSPHFRGQVRDIDEEFIEQLQQFVPGVFSEQRLVPKSINGTVLTCEDLLSYFKAYSKVFQGTDLPEPKSILHATAEANNLAALNAAKKKYTDEMEGLVGGTKPYVNPDLLRKEHEGLSRVTRNFFGSFKKMGGKEFSRAYEDELDEFIADRFTEYSKQNEGKNIFGGLKVPVVLVALAFICHIIVGLLILIRMPSLVYLPFSTVFYLSLAGLTVWIYVKYSGNYPEVGAAVEQAVELMLENVNFELINDNNNNFIFKYEILYKQDAAMALGAILGWEVYMRWLFKIVGMVDIILFALVANFLNDRVGIICSAIAEGVFILLLWTFLQRPRLKTVILGILFIIFCVCGWVPYANIFTGNLLVQNRLPQQNHLQ